MRRTAGLRAKLVFAITTATVVSGAMLAGFSFLAARKEAIRQLKTRGNAITDALAYNSRLGVISNDENGLKDLLAGVNGREDVIYAFVADANGVIVAQARQPQARGVDFAELSKAYRGVGRTRSTALRGRHGATVFHLVAPVTVTRTSRETEATGELSLFHLAAPEAGRPAREESVGTAHVGMSMERTNVQIRGLLAKSGGLLGGALLVGLLMAMVIAQVVVRPVKAVSRASQQVAAGNLAVRLPVRRRGDELNELSTYFNEMTSVLERNRQELTELADVLKKQRDNERALRDVAVAITGAGTLRLLAERVFAKMAGHIGAHAAIFYGVEDDRRLRAVAGLSIPAERLESIRILFGEGFAGQAAERRERIVATQVPAGTALEVPVLGDTARPRTIVAVPLVFQDHLLGVLELGLYRDPDPETLAFLDVLSDQMGVAANNLVANRRTQELAEQLRLKGDELARQNEELGHANAAIQQANQHKTAFLANMSHELRTPLNSIIGFTRLVVKKAGDALASRQLENLLKVERSAVNLLQIINDILDISKVEAGRMDVVPEPFRLDDVIDDVLMAATPLLGDRPVALVKSTEAGLPALDTDKTRLRQIVLNLVSNAIKFTSQGEVRIQSSYDRAADRVLIAVHDTGIGIARENHARVFEPFKQVDDSTTRRAGGTGLGLAIVRKMTELLGGDVTLDSELGRGSVFVVRIPPRAVSALALSRPTPSTALRRTPAPRAASIPSTAVPRWPRSALPPATVHVIPASAAAPATLSSAGGNPAPSGPTPRPANPPAASRAVVVIDDNPDDAYLLKEALVEQGYEVFLAHNADTGLDLALRHRPFAVTIDIQMPDKDGWQAIREFKQNPRLADIPVVVVSIVDNKRLGYSLGVAGYLTKPFAKEDLQRTLQRIVDRPHDVVLVDDDEESEKLLEDALDGNGLTCHFFRSAPEALEYFESGGPADLVLVDLMMPGMDGFELVGRLKGSEATAAIPIVVVTAKDLTQRDVEMLNSNVVSVIQKGESSAVCGELTEVLRSIFYDASVEARAVPT